MESIELEDTSLTLIERAIASSMAGISKKNQNGVYWDLTPDKKLMLFAVESAENIKTYLQNVLPGETPDIYPILIKGTIVFKDRHVLESFFETELKHLSNIFIHELVDDMLYPEEEFDADQNTFLVEMDGFNAIIELDQKLIFVTNESIDPELLNQVHQESTN